MSDSQEPAKKNPVIRFFKFILGILKGYFMMLGLLVTLLPVALGFLIAKHGGGPANKPDVTKAVANGKPGIVTLQLTGELLERSPDFSSLIFKQFFGEESGTYLPDLRRSLRAISQNEYAKGLHLDLTRLSGGSAEMAELRKILLEFKASNKPLHVFAADLDNDTLLIASAADHIALSPAGSVMLPGPMFQLVYFGEALKKLGINVEVIRHGKYKSAFEPFVLNDPSPESLEMYRSMESDLRAVLIADIAAGRKKSKDEVAGWFSKSLFTAKEAKDLGIVNELTYLSESRRFLETTVEGTGQIELAELEHPAASAAPQAATGDSGIALIEAVGDISMVASGRSAEQGITPETIIAELKWASEDKNVKSVVMRVSSPGGSAVASDLIWREVKRLAEIKPVVDGECRRFGRVLHCRSRFAHHRRILDDYGINRGDRHAP